MNDDNTIDTNPFDTADAGAFSPARSEGGSGAHSAVGPVITMEIVQRYVTYERERNRRILLWTAALSLLLVLAALVAMAAVGIVSLRNSRLAAEEARKAESEAALYVADVTDVSGKVEALEDRHEDTKKTIVTIEARRGEQQRELQKNLVKFSQWVAESDSKGSEAVKALEFRLQEIETTLSGKEAELAVLREQYASLVATIASGALAAHAPGAQAASHDPTEPDASLDELLADFSALTNTRAQPVPAHATPVSPEQSHETTLMTFPNGERYEGQFKEGLFNGQGTYTFSNGDIYTGSFVSDKMVGHGKMTYANGNVYTGEFKNGVREGRGKLDFANGDSYEGDFRNDDRDGSGEYRFANGAIYTGEFIKNERQGKGRYVYPTGDQYVGYFKNGKMDGLGICTYSNGKTVKGLWENGRFVKEIEE